MTKPFIVAALAVLSLFISTAACAAVPSEWGLGFQESASPIMDRLQHFHDMLLYIIAAITVFVMILLAYVIIRFRASANPTPSKTTHNVPLEILWTVVPVIILIVIVIPSLQLLFYMDRTEKTDMTLKITGYQWYWGYEYPDFGGVNFQANMIPEAEIKKEAGQIRLLSTDNPVVIPTDTNIQLLITAADVIHAFTVPAFGVKKDAVPGRLNESWVRVTKPGTYYGQCSEICGKNHAYMPIEFKAVPKPEFDAWIAEQKKAQGIADAPAQTKAPDAAPVKTGT